MWDTLTEFGCLSASFVDLYDTVVAVLYGGDNDLDENRVRSGIGTHPGVTRDARMVPIKDWANRRASRAAKALRNGARPDLILKNMERVADKLRTDLHRFDMCRWCDPSNN